MKFVDDVLNKVTMYRLVLYALVGLWLLAMILGAVGLLPYAALAIFLSGLITIATCWVSNLILAWIFKAPTNVESLYITALILALILAPLDLSNYTSGVTVLVTASVIAMASKYIVAIRRKHLFNPAAFALGMLAVLHDFQIYGGESAPWWVGSASLAPFVWIGGLLMVRKVQRGDLVMSFGATFLITLIGLTWAKQGDILATMVSTFVQSPLPFFAFFLLTEPLTTPPTRKLRVIEGVLVGALSALVMTPGAILLVGNLFAYIVSPKQKLLATLRGAREIAHASYDFVFVLPEALRFEPGQYVELTLAHDHADQRGNRRYFTAASSPTEEGLHIGLKFFEPSSSFKAALRKLEVGQKLVISGVAGDFTLPNDCTQKLVFVAGGIGITPFRSMVKYLMDKGERRDIVLLYSARSCAEMAYRDLFDEAGSTLGMRVCYVPTDERGYITAAMIKDEIVDWQERIYYISGPKVMVRAFEKMLGELRVPRRQIKTDFFPGYA